MSAAALGATVAAVWLVAVGFYVAVCRPPVRVAVFAAAELAFMLIAVFVGAVAAGAAGAMVGVLAAWAVTELVARLHARPNGYAPRGDAR